MSKRFVLFVLAGGTAALVNFASRIALSQWLDYVPAIAIAYCLGMATAFTLNKLFVFNRAHTHLARQMAWFTVVNVAAVLQTIGISLLFAKVILPAAGVTEHAETIAHAIGVAIPVFSSYLGHKYLSFAPDTRKQ